MSVKRRNRKIRQKYYYGCVLIRIKVVMHIENDIKERFNCYMKVCFRLILDILLKYMYQFSIVR